MIACGIVQEQNPSISFTWWTSTYKFVHWRTCSTHLRKDLCVSSLLACLLACRATATTAAAAAAACHLKRTLLLLLHHSGWLEWFQVEQLYFYCCHSSAPWVGAMQNYTVAVQDTVKHALYKHNQRSTPFFDHQHLLFNTLAGYTERNCSTSGKWLFLEETPLTEVGLQPTPGWAHLTRCLFLTLSLTSSGVVLGAGDTA